MNIDLNCDMGENIGNDEDIMPYITSANIACGFHAGDVTTMREAVGWPNDMEWQLARIRAGRTGKASEGMK